MPKPIPPRKPTPESPPPRYVCVAYSDTGLNSRGGACVPCEQSGRIVPPELRAHREATEADLFS